MDNQKPTRLFIGLYQIKEHTNDTRCPIKNDPLCCFAKISITNGTFSV